MTHQPPARCNNRERSCDRDREAAAAKAGGRNARLLCVLYSIVFTLAHQPNLRAGFEVVEGIFGLNWLAHLKVSIT